MRSPVDEMNGEFRNVIAVTKLDRSKSWYWKRGDGKENKY